MKEIEVMFLVLFTLSPIVGFIPQILTNHIVFPELLSVLSIISNVLKIIYFSSISLTSIIPLQAIFSIFLHTCLIAFNKSSTSLVEEKITQRLKITDKKMYIAYVAFIAVLAHSASIVCRTYEVCGIMSLVFEVSVNGVQLFIESSRKMCGEHKISKSQKSLYLVWIVGDICRILFMIVAVTPWMYTSASFVQLAIDCYLLYK